MNQQSPTPTTNTSTGSTKIPPTSNGKEESITMAEAIKQMKDATSSICEAVSSMGAASADGAKAKYEEGKVRAREFSSEAESVMRERPLVTVGVAFAAGWLISRLLQSPSSNRDS